MPALHPDRLEQAVDQGAALVVGATLLVLDLKEAET